MMNEQEFYQNVQASIISSLPVEYANAQVSLTRQMKNNDREMTGLMIRRDGENICPVIYLNDYFAQYENGAPFDMILDQVAKVRTDIEQRKGNIVDPDIFSDYGKVKDMLQMRIFDTQKNEKKLEGIVHYSFGDFSAAYAIILKSTQEQSMSVMITPDMLRHWGISNKQLHEDTIRSDMDREPLLMDLGSVMFSIMEGGDAVNYLAQETPFEMDESMMPIFCLTNKERINGAGLILNHMVQEKIAGLLGGSYYVLPSSIHEVLVMPYDGSSRAGELGRMVHQINATEVSPEDFLSDKVELYDAESRRLVNASEFEQKMERGLPPAKAKAI